MTAHTSVSVLATGDKFVGRGVRAIEPRVWELISEATSEVQIAIYRVDPAAEAILDLLEKAAQSGIRICIVISDLSRQPQLIQHRLSRLAAHRQVSLVDFARSGYGLLHAKVVVIDRRKALVGAANLTTGGPGVNHEIAVLVEGEPAWQIASLIDLLSAQGDT